MICATVADPGFFGILSGLWDGVFSLFALVLSIFWHGTFHVYNACSHGWFYDLGFLLGVGGAIALGFLNIRWFIPLFLGAFVVFIIFAIFGNLLWILLVAAIGAAAFFGYRKFIAK